MTWLDLVFFPGSTAQQDMCTFPVHQLQGLCSRVHDLFFAAKRSICTELFIKCSILRARRAMTSTGSDDQLRGGRNGRLHLRAQMLTVLRTSNHESLSGQVSNHIDCARSGSPWTQTADGATRMVHATSRSHQLRTGVYLSLTAL